MSRELARDLYRTQLRIRLFEEEVARLFAAGELPGFVHLSLGQEAVAAGACGALRPDDVITSNHRGHGHCIAKGGELDRMMAELFGRRDGYCGGLGGSMHIADLDKGILGANGIVGAGILIATGAAYSFQAQGLGRVALAFFGDGATSEGAFHEGLNLAALWRLPVIYLCEDNGFAELTPTSVHAAGPGIGARASAYGMAAEEVDGTDALAVHEVVGRAAARCRAGEGPVLVVAHTNRWHGHFEGDQQRYRSPEELAEARRRDPVARLGERLLAEGWADEAWLDGCAAEARGELEAAVAFAGASPPAEEVPL
jgi:acetoin:2,6-dichlorophenolindophenol oxidoreductase subunit alpha